MVFVFFIVSSDVSSAAVSLVQVLDQQTAGFKVCTLQNLTDWTSKSKLAATTSRVVTHK